MPQRPGRRPVHFVGPSQYVVRVSADLLATSQRFFGPSSSLVRLSAESFGVRAQVAAVFVKGVRHVGWVAVGHRDALYPQERRLIDGLVRAPSAVQAYAAVLAPVMVPGLRTRGPSFSVQPAMVPSA